MAITIYMDVHVARAITEQLLLRGVNVMTVHRMTAPYVSDEELLYRATSLNRILFTRDDDLLRIASNRQAGSGDFSGVVYAHQLRVSIGRCVQDLEWLAKECEPDDMHNRVEYLPL